jgi:hypothetical protein
VLTTEEHAALLRSFAVDRLLQLVTLEAKRRHDGHVTIVALTTHYQVAFGPPTLSPGSAGGASAPRAERPGSLTLKEALMTAIVEGKDGDDACPGAPDAWGEAQARPLTREDWTLIASVTGERLRPFEGGSDIQGMLAGP